MRDEVVGVLGFSVSAEDRAGSAAAAGDAQNGMRGFGLRPQESRAQDEQKERFARVVPEFHQRCVVDANVSRRPGWRY